MADDYEPPKPPWWVIFFNPMTGALVLLAMVIIMGTR